METQKVFLKSQQHSPSKWMSPSLGVFISFFIIYLLTLTYNFSASHDSIDYLNDFTAGTNLLQPHHLLYHVFTYYLYQGVQYIFPSFETHYIIEALNAAWGAGLLTVFYLFLVNRFKIPQATAFIAVCLPAFSYGVWFYSTNVEVYMPPAFFLISALYVMSAQKFSTKDANKIIILHVLAILFHQVNIIFTLIVLWKFWTSRDQINFQRTIFNYAVIGGGFVLLIYFIAGWVVLGKNSPASFMSWLQGYTVTRQYWFTPGSNSFVSAAIGLSHAFLGGHFVFKLDFLSSGLSENLAYTQLSDESYLLNGMPQWMAGGLLVITCLLLAIMFVFVLRIALNWKTFIKASIIAVRPLLITLLLYSVFFLFWMPRNLEFWIFQSVLIWLIIAGASNVIFPLLRLKAVTWLTITAALLFTLNYFGSMRWLQSIDNDLVYAKVKPVTDQATANDLIIVKDKWMLKSYLRRYSKAPVLLVPHPDSSFQRHTADLQLNHVLNKGGRVFLFEEESKMHSVLNQPYVDSLLSSKVVTEFGNELTRVHVLRKQ